MSRHLNILAQEPAATHTAPPSPPISAAADAVHPVPAAEVALSESECRALLVLAQAVLPGGARLPAPCPQTIQRLKELLATLPPAAAIGYRAALGALSAHALLRFGSRLERLHPDKALRLCQSWLRGNLAQRTALRSLLAPLKLAHFGDPAMYARLGCPYPTRIPPRPADRPRGDIQDAAHVSPGETLSCDAVVIGSGAGGAVAACELARAGHAVILLEEGPLFGRSDFTGPVFERQRRLFRDFGGTLAWGARTGVAIPVPIGRGVGGTTMVNSGTCYRVPPRVLDKWRACHGLHDLSEGELDRLYTRVESVLQVEPARPELLGGVARVIARGCDALGYSHRPLRRNAPDCDGQGLCCFGCPTDAKRSTNVSYVPLALRAGAQLLTGARAGSLIIEDGRAVGVRVHSRGGDFTVRARAVVVAAGALMTPVLLLNDPGARRALGRSGQLGANLSIHPAAAVSAVMPELVRGFQGIPQGYAIEEFHDEGLLMEGAFLPPDLSAANSPQIGRPLMDVMEAYDRVACFGFMLEDEGRGRVRPGPGRRPLITYDLQPNDVARLQRGVEILVDIFLHAGAQKVLPLLNGFEEIYDQAGLARLRQARLHARDFELTAWHPLGTARMGADPHTSVVDPYGQAHDLPGLYICDGSIMPTSTAVNPQLTIMALATRTALRLADRLS